MPRPLRIEYDNAYYHVMNRGRGNQCIFHGDDYFQAFLTTLDEAHQRFNLQVLCYCLMPTHYQLLVKTPEGNLGRAMRHINGQYTLRYNHLQKTHGTLFRGRYQAILVQADSYLLPLSRYIHRNPVEAGIVRVLETYPWSSYPWYLSTRPSPAWLYQQEIFQKLAVHSHERGAYRAYIELGIDEEIATFYGKGRQTPYLGGEGFRDWARHQHQSNKAAVNGNALRHCRPGLSEIATRVAQHFGVDVDTITDYQRGRTEANIPRWVFMQLAQDLGDHKLRDIAGYLHLKQTGSIPNTVAKLKARLAWDRELARKVSGLKRGGDD